LYGLSTYNDATAKFRGVHCAADGRCGEIIGYTPRDNGVFDGVNLRGGTASRALKPCPAQPCPLGELSHNEPRTTLLKKGRACQDSHERLWAVALPGLNSPLAGRSPGHVCSPGGCAAGCGSRQLGAIGGAPGPGHQPRRRRRRLRRLRPQSELRQRWSLSGRCSNSVAFVAPAA